VPNTQVSRTLIEDMYKQRFAIDKDRKFLFKDQSALKQLIKRKPSIVSSIEIVPSKLMNTYLDSDAGNAWVPNDWIMMVYRPDMISYAWWHEAGGFQIKYPNYTSYQNSVTMMSEIVKQNSEILNFGMLNECKWEYFTSSWIKNNFNQEVVINQRFSDILVTIIT